MKSNSLFPSVVCLIASVVVQFACQAARGADAQISIEKVAREIRTEIERSEGSAEALSGSNCAVRLKSLAEQVNRYTSADFDRAALRAQAKSAIEHFWRARLALRQKMIRFSQEGQLTPACVSGLRNAFRSFRFLEEYVGLHTLARGTWISPKPTKVFSGGFPAFLQSPLLDKFALKSGDVLVSYGMAYGSAAIAHVGEDSGTFSHMAMVYQNSRGEFFTIEAHPEFGVKVAPLEKYLNDGKGRAALFRHHNTQLATLAAKRIYDIAYKADSSGHPIPYDFAMDIKDHSKLFCTEVVSYAFELAAKELKLSLVMPPFPTKISMQNTYILDSFGIKARKTFAPSDIEVDPQFELLAEWRDLARARLMHHQQAILQSQFHWLDTYAYSYRSDLRSILDSHLLYTARHLPLFEGFVNDMVPPDLSQTAITAVVQVYLVSDYIHTGLIDDDRVLERSTGTLMTQAEIMAAAENNRTMDLEAYLRYQRWVKFDRLSGDPMPPSDQWHSLLRADDEEVN